jgi:hypothetical protein
MQGSATFVLASLKEDPMSEKKPKPTAIDLTIEAPGFAERRNDLLQRLQSELKASSGSVQLILRQMFELVDSTNPKKPYRPSLFGEIEGGIRRVVKDANASKKPLSIPEILTEANDFVYAHAEQLKQRLRDAGHAVKDSTVEMAEATQRSTKGIARALNDGMEAPRRSSGALLGDVDAPVTTGPSQEKKVPEDLKKWVNPGLGRIGNK